MRGDTASRAFSALIVASFVGCMALGAAACVLLSVLAYQVTTEGTGVVTAGQLWPLLIFLGVIAAGAVSGLWMLRRQIVASMQLARRIRELTLPSPSRLTASVTRIGLGGRVRLVDCAEAFSFAYGALSPRVVVSQGLLSRLTAEELDAVLEHELYHVRNLDPLKVVLAGAISASFFYLPALRALRARYEAGRELAADRRALASCGTRPLAGALLKVVSGPGWGELQVGAAIGGREMLDVRVAQIEAGQEPRVAKLSAAAALASLLGAGVLVVSFALAFGSFGGPLAAARATTGGDPAPFDLALGALCALPWVAGAAVGYGRLKRQAQRPLTRRVSSTTLGS